MTHVSQKVYLALPNDRFLRFLNTDSIHNLTSCLCPSLLVGGHQHSGKAASPKDSPTQLPSPTAKMLLHIRDGAHRQREPEDLSKGESAHAHNLNLIAVVQQHFVALADFSARAHIVHSAFDICAIRRSISKIA